MKKADRQIDIFQLPSQSRLHTIKPGDKNGMAMCLSIFYKADTLILIAAFENGYASVHCLDAASNDWVMTYRAQAHSQPILSLDVQANGEYFLTSSADSIIAKHPIPLTRQEIVQVPADKPTKEAAKTSAGVSALSSALSGSHAHDKAFSFKSQEWKDPIKYINTKHSGQQSLCLRSDGKLFATAGWDSNVRVYSAKTLKEMAVLQWHKVGAYAVAFAKVSSDTEASQSTSSLEALPADDGALVSRAGTISSVKEKRVQRAKATHWIATGSKDGKVALWDIY